MIESILPAAVTAVDVLVDPPDVDLFPEEEAVVRNSVDKRRQEFATARWCARQAMGRLGYPPAPILPGRRGEPRWPDGLVGSITHCTGYRGAVLAEQAKVTTVGIDAEPNEGLTNGLLEAVSLAAERNRVAGLLRDHPGVAWDRMLFSAKESVYKAWYPLTATWLDFGDADIIIDPRNGTFTAALLVTGPRVHGQRLNGFTGRWLVEQGLIVTAVTVLSPAARLQTVARRF
jgi:4'-phosphopantetheinyl transferase EntD